MFIMSLFANAQHKLAAWRRRHQAYAELMGLDDRALADIGIHRSQIAALIFGDRQKDREFEPQPQGVLAAHQARLAGTIGGWPPA